MRPVSSSSSVASKKRGQAGLGLSLNTGVSASGTFNNRAAFVAANMPSVNGDEEHAAGLVMKEEPASISSNSSSRRNSRTFEHAGGIRENQYARDNDDTEEQDNDSDIVYYAGNSSIASTSSSRPGTSAGGHNRPLDSNATPVVRQLPATGFSTPLLGTFSHNIDSTLPPSPRSPSFYRDKDDLSFEDPALRYGGLHVNTSDKDGKEYRKAGSTTNLLSGLGVKHANRSASSIVNVPGSPALGATIGSSSSASSPLNPGRGGPSSGWRAIITGKRKIHPLALGPAFLLGIILAASGLFTSSDPASTASQWASSISSSFTSPSLKTALSHLTREEYVSHSSGHVYMDQTRTSLGQITHPIHALIRNATEKWDTLLTRQSKTLPEAVSEYKRRYNRNPPKGFDDWFRYAQAKNVILVDEYDQIHRDILPFLSLSPSLLRKRINEMESDEFTHTFVVKNGEIEITGAKKDLGRATDQADLMKDFVKYLPEVNITMSAHDGPSVLMNWKLRNQHESLAREGKIIDDEEAEDLGDDPSQFGFNLACPEDSRIRSYYNGLEFGSLPSGPSFIQDHRVAMDLCQNPEWQYMHGFTAWQGPRPRHLQPLFSFSKTSMHSDLLCVPLEQFDNTPSDDPEWENKKFAKIIWRGSMTGVWFDRVSWWRTSQRTRLHFLSQAKEGFRHVRFVDSIRGEGNEAVREEEVDLPTLNERYLDAGYVGELHQCTEDDGGCEAIPKEIETVKGMDWESQNDYKYIVDTDGNAWSGRFHRLMASNSLVLKSTIFPEWYTDRIMPWVHYVPLKIDYTDLYDLMAFFSGDIDGNGGHDDLAKEIAYNGKEWTEKHWRKEDMEVYAFRLYLEWARVTAHDRSKADYNA